MIFSLLDTLQSPRFRNLGLALDEQIIKLTVLLNDNFKYLCSVRAYAGKTRGIVYKHQQVEKMKCAEAIFRKKTCFSRILFI